MFLKLFLLFAIVSTLELYILIKLGASYGLFTALAVRSRVGKTFISAFHANSNMTSIVTCDNFFIS